MTRFLILIAALTFLTLSSIASANGMLRCTLGTASQTFAGGPKQDVAIDANGDATMTNKYFQAVLTGYHKVVVTLYDLPEGLRTPMTFESHIHPGAGNDFVARFQMKDPVDETLFNELTFDCGIVAATGHHHP